MLTLLLHLGYHPVDRFRIGDALPTGGKVHAQPFPAIEDLNVIREIQIQEKHYLSLGFHLDVVRHLLPPSKAAEWAGVEGIPPSLREDSRVMIPTSQKHSAVFAGGVR